MSIIFLLLVPLFGLILVCSKTQSNIHKNNEFAYNLKSIALNFSIFSLLISLYMFTFYHFSSNYFQFLQNPINENYFNMSFGVDGCSIYFVLLTTIIIPISLVSNWNSITTKIKSFLAIILLLEILLLSIFLVLDGLLFYVFFESILPPLFILIGMFGSADKVRASFYLFLYTLLGSLFMLLSILKISNLVGYIQYDAVYKSNIIYYLQIFLFVGIFIAFAVKTPTIFLNNWLLKAHVESPLSGSIILAGIVLKLSLYGVFRLMLPLLAKACLVMTKFVYVIGFITIIYGSASTIRTIDVKELIAYSSVCHAAVYLMGVFSNVVTGIEGGILLGLAHGFVSSGLFICVGGVLYDRSHTRLITIYRGMAQTMPIFSVLLFILCLGNCGVPLTLNFIGEFMSLYGVFERHTLFAPLASLSIILSAGYTIYLFNRIAFGGSYSKYFTVNIPDVNKREFYILSTLVVLTVLFGIYPSPILDGIHYNVSMLIYNLLLLPMTVRTIPKSNNKSLSRYGNNIYCSNMLITAKLRNSFTSTIVKRNTSSLFNKKSSVKNKNADLKTHNNNIHSNFTRKTKHFPPATKEWYNSVYHYKNNDLIKSIPALDKTINGFLKFYFNLYSRKLEKNLIRPRSPRRRIRKEMRSTNKIIVSRPELKHTNDKIIVNAYTFDRQNKYLLNKMKRRSIFHNRWIKFKYKVYLLVNYIEDLILGKCIDKELIQKLYENYYSIININKVSLNLKKKLLKDNHHLFNIFKGRNIQPYNKIIIADRYDIYKDFISRSLHREIISVYYRQLIALKKMKFDKKYLVFLAKQIRKFYGKNVHFNFVNLKHLYLNSDLFSTALIIKVKKFFMKKKNFLKVVKKSLLMMNIPQDDPKNIYKEIYKKKTVMQNLNVENFVYSMAEAKHYKYPEINNGTLSYNNRPSQDLSVTLNTVNSVNKEILDAISMNHVPYIDSSPFLYFPTYLDTYLPGLNVYNTIHHVSIINKIANVIKSIRYKSINGIRIEIAGRLNKRSKATRSIFKIRYKGNIRNTDSSDKGLSTVLLRGHYKSNLQYSNLNSKLRGGSFGTKVFVSGK